MLHDDKKQVSEIIVTLFEAEGRNLLHVKWFSLLACQENSASQIWASFQLGNVNNNATKRLFFRTTNMGNSQSFFGQTGPKKNAT